LKQIKVNTYLSVGILQDADRDLTALESLPVTDIVSINGLLSKYIKYENIPYIFKCQNQIYFNKCLDYDFTPKSPNMELSVADATKFSGGYYAKYLKYKQKYLALKNKSN